MGGHGRTGIVGCALLCLLYGLAAVEAVELFNELHGYRLEHGVGGPGQFPHGPEQLFQVERVASHSGAFSGLASIVEVALKGPERDAGGLEKNDGPNEDACTVGSSFEPVL